MSERVWEEVDQFVGETLLGEDEVLDAALVASAAAGLPAIGVSPPQGKLLALLVRIQGARRILELGTLAGYSTIWMARALPDDGRLITLELSADYAAVAAANIDRAGLGGRIDLRVGPASEGLRELIAAREPPFDLVFIDADKQSTPEYFRLALELVRPGSLIITDNAVRGGAIADPDTDDPRAAGMREFHELLAAERDGRVSATTIQTVGLKGYDGFTLALVQS